MSQISSSPSIAPLMKRGLLGLLAMTKERDTVFLCSLTLPLELGEKFRKASGSDWRPSSNMRQLLGRSVSLGGWVGDGLWDRRAQRGSGRMSDSPWLEVLRACLALMVLKAKTRPGTQSFQVILHLWWLFLLKWLMVCNLCLSQPRSSLLYLTRLHLSIHLSLAAVCCWGSNASRRPWVAGRRAMWQIP